VHQLGGVERSPAVQAAPLGAREGAQLVVEERHQPLERARVAAPELVEEGRDRFRHLRLALSRIERISALAALPVALLLGAEARAGSSAAAAPGTTLAAAPAASAGGEFALSPPARAAAPGGAGKEEFSLTREPAAGATAEGAACACLFAVFADGFESGGTSAWSSATP
jgi:hypothetical protein